MTESQLLVINHPTTAVDSIFNHTVDESYLVDQWRAARERYLHYVLTRKGADKEERRTNTVQAYRTALAQFFDGVYDSHGVQLTPRVRPWEVTASFVDDWKTFMSQAGKPFFEKQPGGSRLETSRTGMARSSINQKLAAVKGFYDYVQHKYDIPYQPLLHDQFLQADPPLLWFAETKRHVTLWSPARHNPADAKKIERFNVSAYDRSVDMSIEEVRRLFNQINLTCVYGLRDYALLLALYSTACRISEILNLKWGDLQPTPKGHYVFRFRGKSGKMDEVAMEPETYDAIVAYLDAAGLLDDLDADSYIFTALDPGRITRLGLAAPDQPKPIAYTTAMRILKKYARHAHIDEEKAHPHALRHAATQQTMQTMEDKNGTVDVLALQKILRHANLNTTQVYAKKKKKAEDPWAKARIEAVRPTSPRPRRPKSPPPAQIPLEAAISEEQAEIAQLKAELAALKARLGE